MKSAVKTSLKVVFYVLLSLTFVFLMLFCLFNFGFLNNFSSVALDNDKLQYQNAKIDVYDDFGNLIKTNISEHKNINVSEVPRTVVDAFISVEDKGFYQHDGVSYRRMLVATMKNFAALKVVQGASTITQQLIKNTHLTGDKTLKRKINELLLAKKLEKTLTKDEIMTAYLNAIYFGNGAFGINQAAQRYFSKDASKLTLSESAMLAGLIKSPKRFSPISNKDSCIKRRNLVLKEMKKDKKITPEQFEAAKNEEINLKLNKNFLGDNAYYSQCVDEACKILNITEKDFLLKKYKINCYLDAGVQEKIKEEFENLPALSKSTESDAAAILIDNKTGGIKAFFGKSDFNLLNISRQPGSVLKPIIAFAPALEKGIISPITPILDEKFEINGYSPKNFKNAYHGFVSAKTALANSYNVPAVKILDYVGIENAKKFAQKMGVNFHKFDTGYSLALGGMTSGMGLKTVANCYQAFGNEGKFVEAKFVKSIQTNDGKIIFKNSENAQVVMKDSTAFLLTDMLKESVKSGTSRRLGDIDAQVASKTGTVASTGISGKGNSDVWNVSYTPEFTLCVWFGATKISELDNSVSGANGPTVMARNIYKKMDLKKKKFAMPSSVTYAEISEMEYLENNKILLSNANCPDRFKIKTLFETNNIPKEKSTMFDEIDDFSIEVKTTNEGKARIFLDAKKHLSYEVFRQSEDAKVLIATVKNKQEKVEILDDKIERGNFYTYVAVARYENEKDSAKTRRSNEVKIFLAQKTPLLRLKKGFNEFA